MKKNLVGSKYMATIIAVFSTIIFLFPVYWMFVTSIKPMSAIFAIPPKVIPDDVNFDAYVKNFIDNPEILTYFGNSFIIAGGTLVLTLILAASSLCSCSTADKRKRDCHDYFADSPNASEYYVSASFFYSFF
ncbi:hypothetical protein [Niallia sp. NCCP-28]|uniref:hypothetical protein n=1 Tax=Niallia sp. NCCP-28 TaxID=2934712 RepID=UPI0020871AE5|nr:hypothetical protein [Niallia sp. NCCP-28]GKU82042.1 hypothetical protein NCCP28_14380 [Niallia sp. NCCP-28]